MPIRLRLFRHLAVLALPCWFVAGPLAGYVQDAVACRHDAAHHRSHHGAPSDAPCWCDDMAGGGSTLLTLPPALPPDEAALLIAPAPGVVRPTLSATPSPLSPSYAPTPPPPNGPTA